MVPPPPPPGIKEPQTETDLSVNGSEYQNSWICKLGAELKGTLTFTCRYFYAC
jgi:hypothetical protein